MSTDLLQDLLRAVTPQVLAFWQGADLDALGEAVSWADPGPAPVWLDCARDFTEYWTHLHQILEATGRPPLADDEARHGVLDTFMRALPLTLERADQAGRGAVVTIRVPGPAGGSWTCSYFAKEAAPDTGLLMLISYKTKLWRLIPPGNSVSPLP